MHMVQIFLKKECSPLACPPQMPIFLHPFHVFQNFSLKLYVIYRLLFVCFYTKVCAVSHHGFFTELYASENFAYS